MSVEPTTTASETPAGADPAKRRPRRGRTFLVRLIVVGLSLLLALIVTEIAGRVIFRKIADDRQYYPRLEQQVLRSAPILGPVRQPGTFNPKFGYVLTPNKSFTETRGAQRFAQRTNSHGFYTREIEPRAPGEYRVMLIGDSFFYGSFIEDRERLGAQLEALAAADPAARRPLKVYNFARSGYSSVQELIVAQTYAPRVDPDAIVLGFFGSNDLIANALTRVDSRGNFVPVPEQIAKYRAAIRTTLGPWQHSILGRIAALTTPMGTQIYYQIARQPWVIERNEQVLDQIRDYCRQHDYRFGVVFQHTRDSLSTGTLARAFYQNDAVHDALDRYCNQAGIDFIDIRTVFHAAGDWQAFIHERPDSHPNALGTQKTAEAIYQRMIQPELTTVPKVNDPHAVRNHP